MEDSQVITEEESNDTLIQEMLRDAETAEVSSEIKEHPVINEGTSEMPAPMVAKEISSAGYRYVYNRVTGEKIPVLYYMVPQVLRKKDASGKLRFTVYNPGVKQKKGTHKCWLHPDSPNRDHFDELGFRSCKKANLINPYQVTQHMKRKHPQEFAAIEEERKERERQEDRKLQQVLLKGIAGKKK